MRAPLQPLADTKERYYRPCRSRLNAGAFKVLKPFSATKGLSTFEFYKAVSRREITLMSKPIPAPCYIRWFVVAMLLHFAPGNASADVRLPAIFSDHMVLQADASVPVWGWAAPGEEVTVTTGKQTRKTKANKDGKWMLKLGKLQSGTTTTLTVKGNNEITIKDVLIGEVWLGSGQSNMGMTVERSLNFEQEKAAAGFPSIRMFTVGRNSQPEPQTECQGSWVICSPETVGAFSATAYFFGRDIHQKTGVPVGLINSSWGGTAIEAWTSIEAQSKLPGFPTISEQWTKVTAVKWDEAKAMAAYEKQMANWKEQSKKAKATGKQPPRTPTKPVNPRLNQNHPANLFNGMINPIIPYAIRGVIWYQGENNAHRNISHFYGLQLKTLIHDWRTRWGYEFPFAWVQLPDFKEPQKEPVQSTGWTTVREEMLKSLEVPKTGMAITLGLGEAKDIHPRNKQDVGKRLAMWALAEVYKKKGVASSGPLPAKSKIKGDKVIVSFQHTDGGLTSNGPLKGFAIAGADRKWIHAQAKIDGNKVIVSHPDLKQPVAVRYAWADNPDFSLYNGAGLPASPFRTDDWKD